MFDKQGIKFDHIIGVKEDCCPGYLCYEGIKKRSMIYNNKTFRGGRQIAALLNKKEENKYVISTYYLHLLENIYNTCRYLVELNQYCPLHIWVFCYPCLNCPLTSFHFNAFLRFHMLSQCLASPVTREVISYLMVLGQQTLMTLRIKNFQENISILKSIETFLI